MKLSLILEQARAGELASASDKDKTDRKIVSYINLALVALYNRFQLATQEAIVTLEVAPARTLYKMDGTDPAVLVKGQPLEPDEFMAIVGAYNEDGSVINVNDEKDPTSIYTVTYNQIQIPLLAANAFVSLLYRQNPTMLVYVDDGNGSAVDADVPIPMQLLEAALHYVGYRAHGAIKGSVDADTSTHYTRFLEACVRAEASGVLTADDTVGQSVIEKGFL